LMCKNIEQQFFFDLFISEKIEKRSIFNFSSQTNIEQ